MVGFTVDLKIQIILNQSVLYISCFHKLMNYIIKYRLAALHFVSFSPFPHSEEGKFNSL